ncbi:unnamed protein product [Cochlearia groenlandica]
MKKKSCMFTVVFFELVIAQLPKHCQRSCGKVAIHYPFGISPGCYYEDDPSFKLACSNKTENLLFRGNPIINSSHIGELQSNLTISKFCHSNNTYEVEEGIVSYTI